MATFQGTQYIFTYKQANTQWTSNQLVISCNQIKWQQWWYIRGADNGKLPHSGLNPLHSMVVALILRQNFRSLATPNCSKHNLGITSKHEQMHKIKCYYNTYMYITVSCTYSYPLTCFQKVQIIILPVNGWNTLVLLKHNLVCVVEECDKG